MTMCHQCHDPICKACSLITPQGVFCSSHCSVLNREVKERLKEPRPRELAGFFTKVSVAFVLIVVGFMGIHIAASNGIQSLKRIDAIGLVLKLAVRHQEGGR